ncbi:MAG: AAA family ATPase [Gemmatimonadetes bacterium]|nr:AAA family ATPase [Gemmatimonadota bacterium]
MEELSVIVDVECDERTIPDLEALFNGRHPNLDARISIGPNSEAQQLSIEFEPGLKNGVPLIKIGFLCSKPEISMPFFSSMRRHPLYRRPQADESERPSEIRCVSVGPSLLSDDDIARFWYSVALRDGEARAIHALRLIYGNEVERVVVIGDERSSGRSGQRAIVGFKGQESPVSLKSLGDGAVRLFGVALALANSQDGFLVIDEAENGIHHSVQRDFWKMVMTTAVENNVQVFATTHSWDCVVGFAQAAVGLEEVDGILVRLERDGEQMRVVEYSEEELRIAGEQSIEVR